MYSRARESDIAVIMCAILGTWCITVFYIIRGKVHCLVFLLLCKVWYNSSCILQSISCVSGNFVHVHYMIFYFVRKFICLILYATTTLRCLSVQNIVAIFCSISVFCIPNHANETQNNLLNNLFFSLLSKTCFYYHFSGSTFGVTEKTISIGLFRT